MRLRSWSAAALVVPVLVGVTASAALLVDYLRPSPVFCSEGGACDAVKHTALASPFGVPMPAYGMLGFALLGVLALSRGPRARTLHRVASIAGAMAGVALILAQVVIGHLCPYCLAVDASACLACAVAVARSKGGWDLEAPPPARAAVAAVLAALPTAVLALGLTAKVHVPEVIVEEMKRAPKGQALVVEFVDFECPFCRDEYDDLAPMLEADRDRVHVVRKLVPLTRIHPHALEAARAACCADALGQGDAMAAALFHAPVEELTAEGCQKIASALGLDSSRYAACLADPATEARIAEDRRVFDRAAAKGDGLPLLFIGERKVMGLRAASELRQALDQAIAKAGS